MHRGNNGLNGQWVNDMDLMDLDDPSRLSPDMYELVRRDNGLELGGGEDCICVVIDSPKESRANSDEEDLWTGTHVYNSGVGLGSGSGDECRAAPDEVEEIPIIRVRNLRELMSDPESDDDDDEIICLGTFENKCSKPSQDFKVVNNIQMTASPTVPLNLNVGWKERLHSETQKNLPPPGFTLPIGNRPVLTPTPVVPPVDVRELLRDPLYVPEPGPSRVSPVTLGTSAPRFSPFSFTIPPVSPIDGRPGQIPYPSVGGNMPGSFRVGSASAGQDVQVPFPGQLVMLPMNPILAKATAPVALAKNKQDLDIREVQTLPADDLIEKLRNQRLLKRQMWCTYDHIRALEMKLVKDISPQPHGGHLVWQCLSSKHIMSVLTGSIFEACSFPLVTVIKMMHHWAHQSAQEMIYDLIKVDKAVIKDFFSLIRSSCTFWLHEAGPMLGGENKRVQVFIHSWNKNCGENPGTLKILGVYDAEKKFVRFKILNNINEIFNGEYPPNVRQQILQEAVVFQILWALSHWVDKKSIIVSSQLQQNDWYNQAGFENVECSIPSFLRDYMSAVQQRLEPSVYSMSIPNLQLYLDELSWREHHAPTGTDAYVTLLRHLSVLTNQLDNVSVFLRRIQMNPFVDWSVTKQIQRSPAKTMSSSLRAYLGFRESIKYVEASTFLCPKAAKILEFSRDRPPPPPHPVQMGKMPELADNLLDLEKWTPNATCPSVGMKVTRINFENLTPTKRTRRLVAGDTPPKNRKLETETMRATLNSCFSMLNKLVPPEGKGEESSLKASDKELQISCWECNQNVPQPDHYSAHKIWCQAGRQLQLQARTNGANGGQTGDVSQEKRKQMPKKKKSTN